MRLLLSVALGLLLPRVATAHVELLSPAPRHAATEIKDPPCGLPGSARGSEVTVLEPGATLEVRFREYVDHPGHYRVAFDAEGDDDFVDPVCLDNCDDRRQPPMVFAEDPSGTVLADFVVDDDAEEQSVRVTLPDVECERCTLQLIQVMYDKRPYTSPGNDNYYACADLALRRPPGRDAGPGGDAGPDPLDAGALSDAGGADAGSGGGAVDDATGPAEAEAGCAASASTAPAPWLLVALVISLWTRRASNASWTRQGRRG